MNKKFNIIISGLLILAIVAVSGCIGGDSTSSDKNTFTGNGISFEYPKGWVEFPEEIFNNNSSNTSVKYIVAVGDNKTNPTFLGVSVFNDSTDVSAENMSSTMGSIFEQANISIVHNKTADIDGSKAYIIGIDLSDLGNGSEKMFMTYVFFEKNSKQYMMLYIYTNPDGAKILDEVIASFKFKN